jgi:hypothetical protein
MCMKRPCWNRSVSPCVDDRLGLESLELIGGIRMWPFRSGRGDVLEGSEVVKDLLLCHLGDRRRGFAVGPLLIILHG